MPDRPLTFRPPPTRKPPANVEVAVVLVALKYGAPIFDQLSMPPAKLEVAVDLIPIGIVAVGVRAFTERVSVCCCQLGEGPPLVVSTVSPPPLFCKPAPSKEVEPP